MQRQGRAQPRKRGGPSGGKAPDWEVMSDRKGGRVVRPEEEAHLGAGDSGCAVMMGFDDGVREVSRRDRTLMVPEEDHNVEDGTDERARTAAKGLAEEA